MHRRKVLFSFGIKTSPNFRKPTGPVRLIYFKGGELKEPQVDRHDHIDTVDSESVQTNGREKVNVVQSYDGYWQDIHEVLQKSRHKQGGRLGRIGTVKHCIELPSTDISDPFTLLHTVPGPNHKSLKRGLYIIQHDSNDRHEASTMEIGFTNRVRPKKDGSRWFCA